MWRPAERHRLVVSRCFVVYKSEKRVPGLLFIRSREKMTGTIISGVIFCIVAMIMLGIGVSQLKSKEPVGFIQEKTPRK